MSIGERITSLVLAAIFGAIGYGVGRITLFSFSVLAEMLKVGMVLTAHNAVVFLGVGLFFILMLVLTAIAVMLAISYFIDTFTIHMSNGDQ